MNLADFYIDDFVVFDAPGLTKETVVGYIEENILSKLFSEWELVELNEMFEVQESDRIVEWHNDSKWGMNVTFLYYMSDMSPEVGGSISIRNSVNETKIYPKKGTLIMMSQKKHVEHKAEYAKVERHMFNIDFDVKGY